MDEDTTWYRSRPWPRPHCIRLGTMMQDLIECFTGIQETTVHLRSFLCKIFNRVVDCKHCMCTTTVFLKYKIVSGR